MGNTAELGIYLRCKDDASRVLDDVTKKTGGLGKAFGDMTKIAGGFIMAQGLQSAAGFLVSAAQAAADDAASMAKLQQAVENSGAAWDSYKGTLDTVITAAQKRGFTDDQARDALALLVAQTGSAEEASKRFAMAQDLARGANIDVVTASKLLGKVTDENVSVLSRYGIVAKEGMTQTELFGMIQQKFGGQAEAFASSTAGQMEAAKIQMQELKESIGYALMPVMTKLVGVLTQDIIPAIQKLVAEWGPRLQEAFGNAKTALEPFIDALKGPLKDALSFIEDHREMLVGTLAALGVAVAVTVVPAFLAWAAATIAATWPILAIIAAGALLGLAIKLLIDNWDEIKAKTLEVWGAIGDFVNEKLGFLKVIFETYFTFYKGIVEMALKDIMAYFQFGLDTIKNTFAFFKAIFSGDWEAAWNAVKDQFGAIWDLIATLFQNRLEFIRDMATYALAVLKNVFFGGFNAVKDAVTGIMDALRDFLAQHWQTIVQVALAVLFPPGAGIFWIVTHFEEVKDKVLLAMGALKTGLDWVWAAASAAVGAFVGGLRAAINGVVSAIENVINAVADAVNAIPDIHIPFDGTIGIPDFPHISLPRLAEGVRGFPGGLAWVGEQGPELAYIPRGSDVYSAQESRSMAGGGAYTNFGRHTVQLVFPNVRDMAGADRVYRGLQ
jgi:phage-related protein